MGQTLVEPEEVTEADLVARHRTRESGWSWSHPEGGFRRFEVRHQVVREPLRALVVMVDPRASLRWRDPGEVRAWRGIYSPALVFAGDPASLCRQIAPARWCRISALWENYLQCLHDQLHPAVFFDRQKRNNLASGCNDDRDYSKSGRIHMR